MSTRSVAQPGLPPGQALRLAAVVVIVGILAALAASVDP